MSFNDTKQKIEVALRKLRVNDSFLIDANTNERTISHKLAEYLQESYPRPDWNVDCEYNRHGLEKKEIDVPKDNINWDDTEARTIFPDIVVHKRNNDNYNRLVIEVKKSSNKESHKLDKIKLMALTREPYRYNFGLFLEISVSKGADFLQWFVGGKIFHEQSHPN